MTNSVVLLESLPNEIFIEIFKYLQTEELFQSFYNLNYRFNTLIQSLTHLIYSTNKTNTHPICSYPYIRTLIINTPIETSLNHFPNIRRLILDYVTDDLLLQLNNNPNVPHLESISINPKVHPWYISQLNTKIFSNTFPHLKSCYLSRIKPPTNLEPWTQTYSLRSLKLNDIDSFIYTSILSACPNLYFLKFKLSIQSKIQSNIFFHKNLKHLIINMNYNDWPWDDHILEDYLLYIPNLEQFRIYRSILTNTNLLNSFQYYDWLYSIISSHLKCLEKFRFDLYLIRSINIMPMEFQNICVYLRKIFSNIYKNQYQSRLIVF